MAIDYKVAYEKERDKTNEVRKQRDKYICELVDLQKKYEKDTALLHKRIDQLSAGVKYTANQEIEYMSYDLESCLSSLAPDIDIKTYDRKYGSDLGGTHSSVEYCISMLVANINYLKKSM